MNREKTERNGEWFYLQWIEIKTNSHWHKLRWRRLNNHCLCRLSLLSSRVLFQCFWSLMFSLPLNLAAFLCVCVYSFFRLLFSRLWEYSSVALLRLFFIYHNSWSLLTIVCVWLFVFFVFHSTVFDRAASAIAFIVLLVFVLGWFSFFFPIFFVLLFFYFHFHHFLSFECWTRWWFNSSKKRRKKKSFPFKDFHKFFRHFIHSRSNVLLTTFFFGRFWR